MNFSDTSPLSRRSVLLSWALSEALSPRWRGQYAEYGDRIIAECAAGRLDFLSPAAQAALLATVQAHRKFLIAEYIDPTTRFEWCDITPDRLESLALMPAMAGGVKDRIVTLAQYIQGEYSPDLATDPRNAARRMMEAPEKVRYFGYPVLAWDATLRTEAVIEGYTRLICALYRKQAKMPVGTIRAIRCLPE